MQLLTQLVWTSSARCAKTCPACCCIAIGLPSYACTCSHALEIAVQIWGLNFAQAPSHHAFCHTAAPPPQLTKLSQPSPAHRINANGHSPHPTTYYLHACLCFDAQSKASKIRRDSESQLRSQFFAVVTGSQGYSRMHGCVSSSGMASIKRANSDAYLRVDISLLHDRDRSANLSAVSTP